MNTTARAELMHALSPVIVASDVERMLAVATLTRIGWKSLLSSMFAGPTAIRQSWLMLFGWTIEVGGELLSDAERGTEIQYRPGAVAPTRIDKMAEEMRHALLNTSASDISTLLTQITADFGSALGRRVLNIFELVGRVAIGSYEEAVGLYEAYNDDRAVEHLSQRLGAATDATGDALKSGAESLSQLYNDLTSNPADAAPKLLVLVLSSVAASGGVDGNGGIPDMDIPLMGIGAHRSPFTHSIIIGSLLETALMLLTRIVLTAHKNLPMDHDPLWDGMVRQSVNILKATGKGASIGIAYHLMVDAVVQPGTYHDIPFDMSLETHQGIFAANSIAEASAANSYMAVAGSGASSVKPDGSRSHNDSL